MYNIGILTACESERHLSSQIFRELSRDDEYNPTMVNIEQNDIADSYFTVRDFIHDCEPDFILSVGDRPEQMGGVLAAFHNKIPIGHLYAGDRNTISHNAITTFDDVNRHAISLYSNIQFCSCEESKVNVELLMSSIGLTPNAHNVGATHFDDIDLEKIGILYKREHAYILILINSETSGNDNQLINDTVTSALEYKDTHHFIILAGNGDSEILSAALYNTLKSHSKSTMYPTIKHEHFLSLMMGCDKFITNSSSVNYEAPFLMNVNDIIKIGDRNKNRTVIPISSHSGNASKKVACLIKDYCSEIIK